MGRNNQDKANSVRRDLTNPTVTELGNVIHWFGDKSTLFYSYRPLPLAEIIDIPILI